jgi:exosortase/archaeosortase family protein
MIGLLFGELKRFSVARRVALVAGAVSIALFANFCRAVFLVMVAATENISEVTRWHDVAGYTILALVFFGTMGLAYSLARKKPPVAAGVSPATMQLQPARLPLQVPAFYLVAALCWLLLVEVGTAAWYHLHELNLVSTIRWSVQWPEQAPNFRKLKIDEEIRSVLRFDEGQGATWTITSPEKSESSAPMNASEVREPKTFAMQVKRAPENTISCLVYVFRWEPGRNSALLANLHRPDVCLPASGWKQVADYGVQSYPITDSVELPFRHFEFQRTFEGLAPQTAHAFYCLSEDRASRPTAASQGANSPGMSGIRSEWTRAERVRSVLEGRRHLGQQVIEAIFISSEPFSAADAESHLRNFTRDVVRLREVD